MYLAVLIFGNVVGPSLSTSCQISTVNRRPLLVINESSLPWRLPVYLIVTIDIVTIDLQVQKLLFTSAMRFAVVESVWKFKIANLQTLTTFKCNIPRDGRGIILVVITRIQPGIICTCQWLAVYPNDCNYWSSSSKLIVNFALEPLTFKFRNYCWRLQFASQSCNRFENLRLPISKILQLLSVISQVMGVV